MSEQRSRTGLLRTRWAAIGAAIAVTLGAGGIGITHATTTSGERPIYLPIEPCRLADTRPAFNVGPRATPLGAAETYDIDGWGTVGNCTLPNDTAGLALNVTAVDPSAPTFLTLFPEGTTLPLASHLNPTPGQPPTPNAVNVDLSSSGEFSIYNLAGNVHIAIDVVGIYDDHNHDDRYYTETEVDAALALVTTNVSRLNYSGSTSATPGNFEKLRDVGDFTKVSGDTGVKLTWQSHVDMSAGVSCTWQIRVNDLNGVGGSAFTGTQAVTNSSNREALSVVDIFSGLAAGTHTVSIWVRGAGSPTCRDNGGNFERSVLVEEMPVNTLALPTGGATATPDAAAENDG